MYAAMGAAVFYLLFRIAVIGIPGISGRLWGLNFPAYILSWDIWLAMLLPLVFAIPAVAKITGGLFMTGRPPSRMKFYAGGLVLTITLLILANEFQVLYSFLGDGSYCHAEVYRVKVDPGMESQLFDKPTAYATGQALRFIAANMEFTDNRYPFMLLSIIGIILLIPAMFYFLRDEPPAVSVLLVTVVLGGPALLFFFGYIELYTIQYVFLALFFLSAYRALTHGESIVPPLLFLAVSAAFGGSSLIYGPSALFLIAAKMPKRKDYRRAMAGLIALTVLLFAVLLLIQWDDMRNPYLIPLVTGNIVREDGIMSGYFGYSMFSVPHLIDMLNTLLFIGGVTVVAGVAGLLSCARTEIWESPAVQFSSVAAAAGVLLLLGGNASFGLARDWDLAVIPMFGITFFAAAVLIRLHELRRISLQMLLPVLLLASAGTAYAWIDLNHRPASAQRLEDIIAMDDTYVAPIITYTGYENLRKYYAFAKQRDDRLRVIRKMIPTGWHIGILYNEGITESLFLENERRIREELGWYFSRLIDRMKRDYPENHYRHIPQERLDAMLAGLLLYIQPVKPEIAEEINRRAHAEVPSWPYYTFVAIALDESVSMREKAERTDGMVPLSADDAILLARMADFYRFAELYSDAVAYYERALEVEAHEYPNIYMSLASIYASVYRDFSKAKTTLERCLENCRLSPHLPKVRQMLDELRGRRDAEIR